MAVKTTVTKNDRTKLEQSISGMHQAAAMLTKQPVFALSPVEAKGLSNALCDVLDYHEIDLTTAGGVGGLYLALGLTVFSIYKPRLDYIKAGGATRVVERAAAPATPGDAKFKQTTQMDFTGDGGAAPVPTSTLVLDPVIVAGADKTPIRFN